MVKWSLSLWIAAAGFVFLAAVSPAWAIKPRPPLQLSLQQAKASEGETMITLTAAANVDINRVTISVELSPGLSLAKGQPEWEGPLKKGEKQQLEFVVQNPNHTPEKVTGKAIVHLEAGGEFIQKSTLIVNRAQNKPPSHSPSVQRKQGDETIHEYKGE